MSQRGRRSLETVLQLRLELDVPPRSGPELLKRLEGFGMRGITRLRLTRNRAVMVSFSGPELRVHSAYLGAPPEVLQAIVVFVLGRTRADRRPAQRTILAFEVDAPSRPAKRRPERPHPDDVPLVRELHRWHRELNQRSFGGRLQDIPIRISGRMHARLGQYTVGRGGDSAEIAISRSHIRRHGWAEALHTLLHEMVHQWQAESDQPIDHGSAFRAKAAVVGIAPYARRELHARGGRSANGGEGEERVATGSV
ncbi:MAG: SprT-like domain-containing protein [Gemmatimonadota bacterium]|nr:SprT-like domain-containing protein [Gemmatimonadota bacterium]